MNKRDLFNNMLADEAEKYFTSKEFNDLIDASIKGESFTREDLLRALMENIENASDEEENEIVNIICDARCKDIAKRMFSGENVSDDDLVFMSGAAGNIDNSDYLSDDFNDDDDDMIKKYAEHLKNYMYRYKPEATEIDNKVDPDEDHIGIMAQDLEEVNPACVKETEEGVKTVDTSRLALMNAGVIGDLARRLQALEDKINEQ